MSTDGPRRREIEDSTAARLAEIVAAAERAAKQVIDEAEAEARSRLADASEEADRIVAERLAGLAEMTDQINVQAEALRRQTEDLQRALALAKASMGGAEALGGSAAMRRRDPDPELEGRPAAPPADTRPPARPVSPSLTVVGDTPQDEPPFHDPVAAAAAETASPHDDSSAGLRAAIGETPAGARLLATQMAVSGSSRDEIEARLRSGFAITDTGAILDAILGPEQ